MNDRQLLRYSRHILLDDIGIEGQEKLRDAHALVIGAGCLGSPAAIYLAASGVGRLTLVDGDEVDLTNLQRQILHGTPDVGAAKVASGKSALHRLNPDVEIRTLNERVAGERLQALIAEADVVLDCSDNFATRHAINRACVAARKPLVSGAAIRFDGQIASFDLRVAPAPAPLRPPCYACLFPESDEVEDVQCSTMGVFAPLTGVIGAMQAAEAIKLVIGLPSLSGRLLLFDARSTHWQTIVLERDPGCPVCGDDAVHDGAGHRRVSA
ncbi:MAG: HesA/MoeB/ThiF family protein [Burkholderiaceae bacterium]